MCRAYRKTMKLGSFPLPFREPLLITGPGSALRLPALLAEKKLPRVLFVTGRALMGLGLPGGESLYPVPKIMSRADFEKLLRLIR